VATDIVMPRLSDSMEEGTVLKWLVEVGGEVQRGEPIAEIETDKANMTFESDTDGTLIEVLASEGDTLAIGEVIARVGEPGEAPSGDGGGGEESAGDGDSGDEQSSDGEESPAAQAEEGAPAAESSSEGPSGEPEAPSGGGGGGNGGDPAGGGSAPTTTTDDGERLRASPVARRMARELSVELGSLEGSGPGGRIVKADVESASQGDGATAPAEAEPSDGGAPAEKSAEAPSGDEGAKGRVETHELTRLQKTVARRMAESKATAPDFALDIEIDMAACVELRGRLKPIADPVPSVNDMVVKACALALREHPKVNGAYRDGAFELYGRVNIGVAVAGEEALVVPTVFDAGTKSLGDIARDARELVKKVHEGTISPPELSGGTFTVSNLGMFGIESFTAVINPPQAGILAVGALKKKAVVDDAGRIVARDMMSATLVSDHRILYGADAARFLARVKELLEQPLALAL
jgi:pyruvate dehydrogenase E2 component (dihydrolipoamide acetyltransferase)